MTTLLKELIDTDIAFSKLSVVKGSEYAFKQYLTTSSVMLPQNKKPIFGIRDICKSMQNSDSKEILSWKPQGGKVSKSEDLGYTWGTYVLELTCGRRIEGKYLNIWVRQNDGNWKVEVDMGNSNPK